MIMKKLFTILSALVTGSLYFVLTNTEQIAQATRIGN
jgi:hypothetical protein